MHVERVQFDEVFDVAASRGCFSFRNAGRTEYGIRLEDGTIPRNGATFAIAFAEPGNWTTVLGWRDLAMPSVTLSYPVPTFLLTQSFEIMLYGPFLVAGALVVGSPGLALAVAALIFGIAFFRSARRMRCNRAVKRALRTVAVENGSAQRAA